MTAGCPARFLFSAFPFLGRFPAPGRFPFSGMISLCWDTFLFRNAALRISGRCVCGGAACGGPVRGFRTLVLRRFAVAARVRSGLSFPFRGVSPVSARPFCISALSGRRPVGGALCGLLRCGLLGGFLFPRGFRVGLHARREASGIGIEDKSGQFLDVFQQRAFVFRAECDRRAVVPGASRASDAVYIGFGHFRQVVIDDQRAVR